MTDKCPKCGAELRSPNAPHRGWSCGSEKHGSFFQSSQCRIRELEAELLHVKSLAANDRSALPANNEVQACLDELQRRKDECKAKVIPSGFLWEGKVMALDEAIDVVQTLLPKVASAKPPG